MVELLATDDPKTGRTKINALNERDSQKKNDCKPVALGFDTSGKAPLYSTTRRPRSSIRGAEDGPVRISL
jgi:hypothetical protein